ncbi:MAG: glycosyltransferase family 2 protein [Microcoleaceae cyanobacterium]
MKLLYPIKVVDWELSQESPTLTGLEGYMGLQALVKLQGVPLGIIQAPITAGICQKKILIKGILEQYRDKILPFLLLNGFLSQSEGLRLEALFDFPWPQYQGELPLVTVAICLRESVENLVFCLDSIRQLDYPYLDILIIDNSPQNEDTEKLVSQYPEFRYVREPRPGLSWARNRAILEAKGDIIAFTDEDVIVDRAWVRALAEVFGENPEVMAVTGLVVPYELETQTQVLWEKSQWFERTFQQKWYHRGEGKTLANDLFATWQLGMGKNMAYRRSLFHSLPSFNPSLGVGTPFPDAESLEMFFQVLKNGYTLVYEPRAFVRHRYPQNPEKLDEFSGKFTSIYGYLISSIVTDRKYLKKGIFTGFNCFFKSYFSRLFLVLTGPSEFSRDLIVREGIGILASLPNYQKSRKQSTNINSEFGDFPDIKQVVSEAPQVETKTETRKTDAIAVRIINLNEPLQPLTDVIDYRVVRIFVKWNGSPFGEFDIINNYYPISINRLGESIMEKFGHELLPPPDISNHSQIETYLKLVLQPPQKLAPESEIFSPVIMPEKLSPEISVSIVIATYDRPDGLRNCLQHLMLQESPRKIEIIIVDNHPSSGITEPIIKEFPGVILVKESRQGLPYARNAGILASTGEIIIATDDDVTTPPDWLEKLLGPFVRPDVMVVTGNVLPLKLEYKSQCLFQAYGKGGLGKGFKRFEANSNWFTRFWWQSVPTWELGATANAAFRAEIFSDPEIGLVEETLGAGTPTGAGEDLYLFYKVLKAGYTIVYEPRAWLCHDHRAEMTALRRQLYNYGKGSASYMWLICLRDGDLRILINLWLGLPWFNLRRIIHRILGRTHHPISLTLWEALGHLLGGWALWQSYQRVKREGRSQPYIPVRDRVNI